MNLSITKDQLINGLQAVQNVVSTRTTLPILSNVLMRAEGERIEFTATDLDVTIACSVEASKKAGIDNRSSEEAVRICSRVEQFRDRYGGG
jgi:DNA polymerase-3 subunit beta